MQKMGQTFNIMLEVDLPNVWNIKKKVFNKLLNLNFKNRIQTLKYMIGFIIILKIIKIYFYIFQNI